MKDWQYFGLLGTIWIAPVNPGMLNAAIAIGMLAMVMVHLLKGD